jgi:hypothetical protein
MPHQSPDQVTIHVDAPGAADIEVLESVGKIYEVGINGVGYMLEDNPADPDTLAAVVIPSLDAPRLATSDTPLSQSVERYVLETFHDWSGGAGQRWLNRADSDPKAFWDSDGVDPFTVPGELSLLPSTTEDLDETYTNLRLVVVGNDLYAQTDDDGITRRTGGSWGSEFTVTDSGGAVVLSDLASDGQYWYGATGNSIIRGTTTDPGADWSTQDAVSVKWAAGRICAAVKEGSSSTPNRFTTLTDAGVEELTNGHLTLDEGHTIALGGAAGGSFYFGSHVGDQGQIWAWQLGLRDDDSPHVPYVAWDMPQGLIPAAVETAGGEIWVRAYRAEGASAGEVLIYRGVPGQGLTPFLVAELGTVEQVGEFAEVGDLVVFSWEDSSGDAGLGAVSLVTGGYSRWLKSGQSGVVRSVVEYQGREAFVVSGHGVYLADTNSYEQAGWLRTSIVDGGSILDKVFDTVTLEVNPLDVGESVTVDYTLDSGGSYVEAGMVDTDGAQRRVLSLDLSSATFGLEFALDGDGTSSTTMFTGQLKYHALGLRDQVLTMRVKAADNLTGLNGADLQENRRGRGAEILRELEALGQTRVLVQDVDWHLVGGEQVFELISVQCRRRLIWDSALGAQSVSGYADLTFRRTES